MLITAALVAFGAVACGDDSPVASGFSRKDHSVSPSPLKPLTLVYDKSRKPVPGTPIQVTGQDLPPNRKVSLVWGTVEVVR